MLMNAAIFSSTPHIYSSFFRRRASHELSFPQFLHRRSSYSSADIRIKEPKDDDAIIRYHDFLRYSLFDAVSRHAFTPKMRAYSDPNAL